MPTQGCLLIEDMQQDYDQNIGIKFFETVIAATASGKLLYTDAYKLTNLYGSTFSNFKTHLES
jgi:hypothetical protein